MVIWVIMTLCFVSCGQSKIVLSNNNVKDAHLAKEYTSYIIKKPIDLNGGTIAFAKGSTIVFKRQGSISNGTIIGDETLLKNPQVQGVRFKGSFINTDVTLSDRFDGETDFWGMVQSFPKATIVLGKNLFLPDCKAGSISAPQFHLEGKGNTVTVRRCPVLKNADVNITNTVFDCSLATERAIYGIAEDLNDRFIVKNCRFINVPEINTICSRAYHEVSIEGCEINGTLIDNSKSTVKNIMQIRTHSCTGSVVVKKNIIKNCYGAGIAGTYFNPDDSTHVLVEDNTIDHVSGGGIIFVSGAVRNAIVRGNNISRTHTLGKQFEGEINGGPSSAINFHGFHNALVENNVIDNCPNSSCFDFDGSLKGKDYIAKGTGLTVRGNKVQNSGPAAIYVVEQVDFSNNKIEGNVFYDNTDAAVFVMGARNVTISGNDMDYSSKTSKTIYPIYVKDHNNVVSGKLLIENNNISTTGDSFIYVHKNYTGECEIDNNVVLSSKKNDGTLEVINKSKSIVKVPTSGKIILKQ